MNNEEKILELLSESLQRLDRMDSKIDNLASEVRQNSAKIDSLTGVLARQNTILRSVVDDIQELKGVKIDVRELERRVGELERYTGKK